MSYMINWDSGHQMSILHMIRSGTVFFKNMFYVITNMGQVLKSKDCINYISVTDFSSNGWKTLLSTGSMLVAATESGYISTSSDGTTWSSPSLPSVFSGITGFSMVYDGTTFYAYGALTDNIYYVSTSTDLTTWSTLTSTGLPSGNNPFNDKVYIVDNNFYMSKNTAAGIDHSSLYKSQDGVTNWTSIYTLSGFGLTKIQNKMLYFSAIGENVFENDVFLYRIDKVVEGSPVSETYVKELDRIVCYTYESVEGTMIYRCYLGKFQPTQLNAYRDSVYHGTVLESIELMYTENTSLDSNTLLFNNNGSNVGGVDTVTDDEFTYSYYPLSFTIGSGVTNIQLFDNIYTTGTTVYLPVGETIHLNFTTDNDNSMYYIGVNNYNTACTKYVPMEVNSSSVYFPTVFEAYHSGGTYSGSINFTWSNTFK